MQTDLPTGSTPVVGTRAIESAATTEDVPAQRDEQAPAEDEPRPPLDLDEVFSPEAEARLCAQLQRAAHS